MHFVFVGGGDSFDELVALADELGIATSVTFTGRVPDETVFEILSTADVGLCPDPLNPLNDVSTMNEDNGVHVLPSPSCRLRIK